MLVVCVGAGAAGTAAGVHISLDIMLGAVVVLLPTGWLALSLTSARSALSPIWFGLARYSLAALGFAALFALRPGSHPLAVLAGSAVGLFLPSALIAKGKWSGQYGGSED